MILDTVSSSAGRTSAAVPRRLWWALAVSTVCSGLTSTTRAPWSNATNGNDAAGWTFMEVPTTSIASQVSAKAKARSRSFSGSGSPNRTMSGRRDRVIVVGKTASRADNPHDVAVQMYDPGAAGDLVQTVYVLGDNVQLRP